MKPTPTRIALLSLLSCALTMTGCASSSPKQRDADNLARYQEFAGEPVDSFHLRTLQNWVSLGREHFAVYTSLNEAWLIEVWKPCNGLDFAHAISLTSTGSRVYARFDSVRFEQETCRIEQIRKVDARAMKAARRAESASS
jgi:hypothetical protein